MNHAMTMNQFGLVPMSDAEMNETEGGILPLLIFVGGALLLGGCASTSGPTAEATIKINEKGGVSGEVKIKVGQ